MWTAEVIVATKRSCRKTRKLASARRDPKVIKLNPHEFEAWVSRLAEQRRPAIEQESRRRLQARVRARGIIVSHS